MTDERLDEIARRLIPTLERVADLAPKAPVSKNGRHGWVTSDENGLGILRCDLCGGPLRTHTATDGCAA